MSVMIYKNKKGFTLMELIVTVILVAILASYAVYHYNNTMDEGRLNAANGKLAALGGATQRFLIEKGIPADFNENSNPNISPVGINASNIVGECSIDNSTILDVFRCGYAEKNLGVVEGFTLSFAKDPCNSSAGITVSLNIGEGNQMQTYPCYYFDPDQDKVIEVQE